MPTTTAPIVLHKLMFVATGQCDHAFNAGVLDLDDAPTVDLSPVTTACLSCGADVTHVFRPVEINVNVTYV